MSPEQLSGQIPDQRSDVFSFAVVLYELLTGKHPFAAPTGALAAEKILHTPPSFDAAMPAAIRHILEKALEKDPVDRYQSTHELVVDMRRATRKASSPSEQSVPVPAVAGRATRSWWLLAAGLVLAAGGGWMLRGESPATSPAESRLANAKFSRFTDFPGSETLAAVSPDGKFVAFLSDRDGEYDLFVSQIGTGRFTNLTKEVPPLAPTSVVAPIGFTGNGAEVWFRGGDRIRRIPVIGGAPQLFLSETAWHPSWSPDGQQLVFHESVNGDPAFIADPTGANARRLFADEPGIAVVVSSVITLRLLVARLGAGGAQLPPRVVGVVVSDFCVLVAFTLLVTAAVQFRRQPETHKRLMLLASMFLLGPAFAVGRPIGRTLVPLLPNGLLPSTVFVVLGIGALICYDLATKKRIEPATLWGSVVIAVAFATFRVLLFGPWGSALARWLGGLGS